MYTPRRPLADPAPVVVWVHGGGWYQGGKGSAVALKAERFTRAGFLLVAVNYRLSPSPMSAEGLGRGRLRSPTHVRDVARALGWVSRRISAYGGDRRRLVLIGHSAGAQMAALLGARPGLLAAGGTPPRALRGVIALDAMGYDVPALTDPARRPMGEFSRAMYWNAFGTPAEEARRPGWRAASPLAHADRGDPPFMMVVPDSVPRRIREAGEMARRLGQLPGHALWRVAMDHREINLLFGRRGDPGGQAGRAVAFARAVTDPGPAARPTVRGPRLVGTRSGTAVRASFRIGSVPVGALTVCRLDGGPARRCDGLREYRVRPGAHRLRVRAYDFAGRAAGAESLRFTVRRAR